MRSPTDKLGRATVFDPTIDTTIKYTRRDLRWMELIAWHGLLNSTYLHEFTKDQCKNDKSSRIAMTRLRKGGYIGYDFAQRMNDRSPYNFYIYGRTKRATEVLKQEDRYAPFIKPSGFYIHQYGTGTVTGSIHLFAEREGYTYTPGHIVLGDTNLKHDTLNFAFDQLFQLEKDGERRTYGVEFDRSYADHRNEDYDNPRIQHKDLKTYIDKIEKLKTYVTEGHYRTHLDISSGIVILFVFTDRGAEEKFYQAMCHVYGDKSCTYIMTQTVNGYFPQFKPEPPYAQLFYGPWRRHNCDPFFIHKQ